MPMILVMHSVDELRSALADANEFLAVQRGTKRRQSGEGNQEEDRVLGVWLREDGDAGLLRGRFLQDFCGTGFAVLTYDACIG